MTHKEMLAKLEQIQEGVDTQNRIIKTLRESNVELQQLVASAAARVLLANKEGNPILSAWLPAAQAAVNASRRA